MFADVMPVNFEGAKLMYNKGLSNHFQVSHTVNMSTTNSGYKFGATYVGTKQLSPTEAFPVLLGDVDPEGNLNANVIHQVSPRIRCKFASQVNNVDIKDVLVTKIYLKELIYTHTSIYRYEFINVSGTITEYSWRKQINNKEMRV